MTYWNAIALDIREELGRHRFTAEEIKRFAARYDPQPFHLDEGAAAGSLLGALCASGWHTSAIYMRLLVDWQRRRIEEWTASGKPRPRFGPSPGFQDLRWSRPVYAGDTVTYFQFVTSKKLSKSRPGWGIVETKVEADNQECDRVLSMRGAVFIASD